METLKAFLENDGALDVDRNDVRSVWGEIGTPMERRAFDVKPGERYVSDSRIGPENVRDYGDDRTEENLKMLEEVKAPHLAELYKKLLEDFPQLCVVKLVDKDIEGNGTFDASVRDTTTGQIMPVISINFSHLETYRMTTSETWIPKDEKSDKKIGIRVVSKRLALETGADWRKCARNRKLMSAVNFLHEMGHAEDYIDNYLVPEYSSREGAESERQRLADSVGAATQRFGMKTGNEYGRFNQQMRGESQLGLYAGYRHLPGEKYADEFVLNYLRGHYEDFFIDDGEAKTAKEKMGDALKDLASGDERVRVEFGREMLMDAEFAFVMGLTPGRETEVEPVMVAEKAPTPYDLKEGDFGLYGYDQARKYDAEGNYIAAKHAKDVNRIGQHEKLGGKGTIMATFREGGPIYLRNDESGEVSTICSNANGFRRVSKRGSDGKVETQVLFNNEAGQLFRVVST